MNEEQLQITLELAKKYAPRFTFAHYEVEDIEQEIYLICDEVFKKRQFRGESNIKTYLIRSIVNRLSNLQREFKYRGKSDCECGYCKFCTRKNSKNSLSLMPSLEEINMDFEANENEHGFNEIIRNINEKMPPNLRETYLRMCNDERITEEERQEVINVVLEIYRG